MTISQGISSQMLYTILQDGMSTNYNNYANLLAQIASNTKLTSIADDPVATVNVLKTQKGLDNIDVYLENIGIAQDELTELDDILDSLNSDIVGTYRPLAVQAANGTYDSDALQAMLQQLEGGLETIVQLGNTKFNGDYIFAGTNVKTQPFTINKDADGNITSVTYSGTSSDGEYQRYVQTGDGTYEVINAPGDDVFGYYDSATGESEGIIGTMVETINAIKTLIEQPSDAEVTAANEALYSLLDRFDENISEITTTQTKYASTYNNMEMAKTSLDATEVNLTSVLSNLKDIDITEISTELYSAMYAYQASMSLLSQVYQTGTLLNYL